MAFNESPMRRIQNHPLLSSQPQRVFTVHGSTPKTNPADKIQKSREGRKKEAERMDAFKIDGVLTRGALFDDEVLRP
jgi:hypothetical protein